MGVAEAAPTHQKKERVMRIIQVPLRIGLFGGGTDLPSYYKEYGSTIISFAITPSMYLVHNPRPTGGCRLSYNAVEDLSTLRDAKHTLVKAASQHKDIEEPCTLTIISDIPKGTGLGSSSALAVALTKLTGVNVQERLMEGAWSLERSVSPDVGFQDYLPGIYGGFHIYRMDADRQLIKERAPKDWIIGRYGLLLYTGITRAANDILPTWKACKRALHSIKNLAEDQAKKIYIWTPESLGDALDITWKLKQQVPGVCTYELYEQYETAMKAGILGGKLLGAGGGGCWFFIVPPSKRQAVIDRLGLVEIPFKVAERGVRQWKL